MTKRKPAPKDEQGISLVEVAVYILAYRQEFSRLHTRSVVTMSSKKKNSMVEADKYRYSVIDNLKEWEREFAKLQKSSKRLRILTEKIRKSVT